jgi:hypothetical protein
MEQELMNLLFSNGGIAVIIAGIMHAIKKAWKPENKNLYKGLAGLFSLGGGYLALQAVEVSGFWNTSLVYLLLSLFIMAFQLFAENEAWDDIKKAFFALLKILVKK